MKRTDLSTIVEGITDEQITKILDLNSADIGKVKKDSEKLKADYDAEVEHRKQLENDIKALQDSAADADALNVKISALEKQIADREAADKAAAENAALADRFTATVGDKVFLNDFTKNGILEEFKTALKDKDNAGKSDADIFGALVKDREDIFSNPNPIEVTPGAGGKGGITDDDAAIRVVMGLPPVK